MIIGEMDRKVRIYNHSIVKSESGAGTKNRELWKIIFAKIDYQPIEDVIEANKRATTSTIELEIYYLDGINNSMEIELGGEFYEIIAIQPIGRNASMKLKARRIT